MLTVLMNNLEKLDLPPIPHVTREEAFAIEQNAFAAGINAFDLMKEAGKAIANHIMSLEGITTVLVLCGKGNNGGDGIIAASLLCNKYQVEVALLDKPKTEIAKQAFEKLDQNKITITDLSENEESIEDLFEKYSSVDLVIDALYGVGIKSEVRTNGKKYIELIVKLADSSRVISVDLPSGLDCTSGEWHGPEFTPTTVITMQYMKTGLLELPESVEVITADIGIPVEFAYIVGPGHLKNFWARRDPDSHKGQNGRIMVIAGSDEYTGAPVLSGMAALRSGVDQLRIAVPETIRDVVAGYHEDFIVVKVRGERHNIKGFKKFKDLTVQRHDVVTIGMGLSNHPISVQFVLDLFKDIRGKVKVVLDADAIRAFKDNTSLIKDTRTIITPHQAELRTMIGRNVPTDFNEKCHFLMEVARELGIVILFKGRIDIITDGQRILFNETGHPGMTVGGTGDVLAGVVGAANCFIEDEFFAAAVATFVMGKAGEMAAQMYGNGLLASDVVTELAKVLKKYDI